MNIARHLLLLLSIFLNRIGDIQFFKILSIACIIIYILSFSNEGMNKLRKYAAKKRFIKYVRKMLKL
jgi:membrane-anchored protein YejM (alkaline phosphatase superfamily)